MSTPGAEQSTRNIRQPAESIRDHASPAAVRLPKVANIVISTVNGPRFAVGTNSMKRLKSTARFPPNPNPCENRQATNASMLADVAASIPQHPATSIVI
eukprot:674693-Rhodomonas_salina.3